MIPTRAPQLEIVDEVLFIGDLVVEDERAVSLVRRADDGSAVPTLLSMIRIGAEGLEAMADVRQLDFVREQVTVLLAKTENSVDRLAERLIEQADAKFDPARQGSYSQQLADEVNRARGEMTTALRTAVEQIKDDETRLRRELDSNLNPSVQGSATQLAIQALQALVTRVGDDFDPSNKNGHAASLIAELDSYTGAGGPFEARLKAELRTSRDELTNELRSLRDLIVREQTVRMTKPTSIGDDFEGAVEAVLSQVARYGDGDWIEDVSRKAGETTNAKSGDFDYHLGSGGVIAVEARNRQGTIGLGGKSGVLEELKRTKANRKADFAVYCVSCDEALPDQVGYLERYDDRIVCCFGSRGEILALAIKFARLCVLLRHEGGGGVSTEATRAALEEIQRKLSTLGVVKRWCSNITEAADKIRAQVGSVGIEVSELVERALTTLSTAHPES